MEGTVVATALWAVRSRAAFRGRPTGPWLHSFELRGCLAQLQTFCVKGVFERGALHIELDVEPPHLEEIANAEKDLELIERLEEEIGRAGTERVSFRAFVSIGGQDDDRQ